MEFSSHNKSSTLEKAKARAYAKVRDAELARAAMAAAKGKAPLVIEGDPCDEYEQWAKFKRTHVYRCNRCGEEFYSFQALGGHCNSHRKLKLLFGLMNNAPTAKRSRRNFYGLAAATPTRPSLPLASLNTSLSLLPPPPLPTANNGFLPTQLHHPKTLAPWTGINMHANGAWNTMVDPNHFRPINAMPAEGKFSWPVEKEVEAALELQLNPYGTNLVHPKNENENEDEDEDDKWVNGMIVDPYHQSAQVDRSVPAPMDDELDLTLHL